MVIKKVFWISIFLISLFLVNGLRAEESELSIALIYPESQYMQREIKKKSKEPIVINGRVKIKVSGINQEQKEKGSYWIEYYLDDSLIFTGKERENEFYFNSYEYSNGEYYLTVNLWDKDYSSGIARVRIKIKNLKSEG